MKNSNKCLNAFLAKTLFTNIDLLERIKFLLRSKLITVLTPDDYEYIGNNNLTSKAKELFMNQARKMHFSLLEEMSELNRLFTQAKVSFVFLKGPLLGIQLYAPPYSRITSDIDLYIGYSDIPKAMDVLSAAGYKDANGMVFSGKDFLYDFCRGDARMKIMGRHTTYVKSKNGINYSVELHANLFRNYEVNTISSFRTVSNSVFQHIQFMEYDKIQYPILGHIDNFLMLCSHFARHTIEALSEFCSVGKPVIDFPYRALHDLSLYFEKFKEHLPLKAVLHYAAQYNCEIDLFFAVKYLSDIYQHPWYDVLQPLIQESKNSDIENVVYLSVMNNFTAKELICTPPCEILHNLKQLIPPIRTYTLQNLAAGQLPVADCTVCEQIDFSENQPAMRPLIQFLWGAALQDDKLYLCIQLPDNIFAAENHVMDITDFSIRIRMTNTDCCENNNGCNSTYVVSFYNESGMLQANLTSECNTTTQPCTLCIEDSSTIVYCKIPVKNADLSVWSFMISAEVSYPNPHNLQRKCSFAVRWIDSVAVSHQACFCYGQLQKKSQ